MSTILQSGAPRLRRGSRFVRGAQAIVAASADFNLVTSKPLSFYNGQSYAKTATPGGRAYRFANNWHLMTEQLPALGTATFVEFWVGVPTGSQVVGYGGGNKNDAPFVVGSDLNRTGIALHERSPNGEGISGEWCAVYDWPNLNTSGRAIEYGKLTCLLYVRRQDRMEFWQDGVMTRSIMQSPVGYPAQTLILGSFITGQDYWESSSDTVLAGRIAADWSPREVRAFMADPVAALLEPTPGFNWAMLQQASQDATAPGAVWAMRLGFAPGAPSAGGTAAGATLPASLALAPGAGQASSTATGAVLPISLSWAPGSASGSGNATAPGASWPVSLALSAGQGSASSLAAGASWPVGLGWAPGVASGSGAGTAPGAVWAVGLGWLPGAASATGQGTAPGATWPMGLSLSAGAGQASSTAPGAVLPISAGWIPGAGSASSAVTAPGAVWPLGLSLAAGPASASSVAAGAVWAMRMDWIPGKASSQGADFTHHRLFVVAPERRGYRIAPERRAYRIKP